MSEEPEPSAYNRIQLSFFANGDQMVFRTSTGEELAEVTEGVAENMERTEKALNAIKQVMIASGVFSGDSAAKGKNNNKERARDSAPPSSGGVPLCDKHGEPMKDFADRGYKHRFYCPRNREESKGCSPKD